MAKRYSVGLVGESYHQEAIAELRAGERLSLAPEPANPHDARAIVVCDGDGRTIGYVPKDHWLQGALIDECREASAIVERITGGGAGQPSLGVVIEVTLGVAGIDADAPAVTTSPLNTPPTTLSGRISAAAGAAAALKAQELLDKKMSSAATPNPKGQAIGKGCAVLLVVVVLLAMLGQCFGEVKETAEDGAAVIDPATIGEDGREAISLWYGTIFAAAKPCDAATGALSDAATAIGRGQGGTLEAYRAAERAVVACRDTAQAFRDINPPAGIPASLKDQANVVTENCETAFQGKQMAAKTATELFDGDMRNSLVSQFTDEVNASQAGVLACIAGAMKLATDAGIPLDELPTG